MLNIEYMIFKDKRRSFANDAESIKKLMLIDSSIKQEDESFIYDSLKFDVKIRIISSMDSKNNYFDFTVSYNGRMTDRIANKITSLHRKIISILKDNFSSPPKILWSDLDSYYSTKAYPLIKDVENLMRKVLTKLLIVKVGYSWEKESVSADLKGKAGNSKGRNIESNYLSALDFIDLTHIIFEKYSSNHKSVIFDEIEKACKNNDLSLIYDILPRSNWQRFLNEHINCSEEILIDKWSKLYDLRCAVAHNTGFTKGDFENCVELTNFIKETLNDSLKNIQVSSEQKVESEENIKINDTTKEKHSTKNTHSGTIKDPYEDLKKLQVSIDRMSNPNLGTIDFLKTAKIYSELQKSNMPKIINHSPILKSIMDIYSDPALDALKRGDDIIKSLMAKKSYYYSLKDDLSPLKSNSHEDELKNGDSDGPTDEKDDN